MEAASIHFKSQLLSGRGLRTKPHLSHSLPSVKLLNMCITSHLFPGKKQPITTDARLNTHCRKVAFLHLPKSYADNISTITAHFSLWYRDIQDALGKMPITKIVLSVAPFKARVSQVLPKQHRFLDSVPKELRLNQAVRLISRHD